MEGKGNTGVLTYTEVSCIKLRRLELYPESSCEELKDFK